MKYVPIALAALIAILPLRAQYPSVTALSVSDTAPVFWEDLVLQAQVSPQVVTNASPPGTVPSGIVTFTDQRGNVLGSASLTSSGSAQLLISASFAGAYTFQAAYSGDSTYASSKSTGVAILVSRAQSTMGVPMASPPNVVAGQNILLTVAVLLRPPSKGTPSGPVTFADNGAVLFIGQLDGSGNASITVQLAAGQHAIVATYAGDVDFFGSSSPLFTLNVQTAFTLTTLGANPSNAAAGQSVVLTASVAATGSGGIRLPTGSVTFMEGSASLGTAALGGGAASFSTSSLGLGNHVITAVYGGDANFASSTSGPVVVNVRIPATVSLSFRQGVSDFALSSAVSGSGSALPTGSVLFTDLSTGKTLGTASLTISGSAMLTITSPPAGHTLQAIYSGDANYPVTTSAPQSLIVVTTGFSAVYSALAPDEFASLFGASLPATGIAITLSDPSGVPHAAQILYASATQVNFIVPGDTPSGSGMLTLNGPGRDTWQLSVNVANVAPGLAPVGQIFPVHADGSTDAPFATATFDPTAQAWAPVTISYGSSSTDTLYLVLYGTGFRHARGTTTCLGNGQSFALFYSGAQASFPGLDQINVLVPATLKAAGQVQVTCSVDGQSSNAMTLVFQ